MRVLALDVGERRIGIALSDPTALLASPFTTVTSRGDDSDIEEVLRIATENSAAEIVVGMPLLL